MALQYKIIWLIYSKKSFCIRKSVKANDKNSCALFIDSLLF
ncbi:unnamed protein product [Schistosoma curassoni]|uniref:Uncharacterized protein n=1 Tax=Schistosoma curassoni TaxID=6186 RepID=A0A183KY58_9TREM|nr:unnamed protein product [Schistosoma curassoni]